MELPKIAKKVAKDYSDALIYVPGDDSVEAKQVDVIPTGSYILDRALGIGGYPLKRLTEIYGVEGSGKTTLALHAVAECQKMGMWALYVDFEHALDLDYMQEIGVNEDKIIIVQPDSGEDGFRIIDGFLRSEWADKLGLIVVDSIAGVLTKQELGGEVGDSHIGLTARLMGQVCRKLPPLLNRKNVATIFINQLRSDISTSYGGSETTPGGRAIPYTAAIRMRVGPKGYVEKGNEKIGRGVNVYITKNKLYKPYNRAEFELIFGKGIYRAKEVIEELKSRGELIQAASWIKLNDEEGTALGQGYDNVYAEYRDMLESMLEEHTD